jgi:hypothetical protein
VLDALIRQLLIFILKYLSGIFLSVDDVLQIGLRRASRSAIAQTRHVRLLQGTSDKYSTGLRRHTFVLLAQRLVLAKQVIALRLHLLNFIMVLGEASIEFGLHHGSVLSRLVELFL